MNRNTFRTLDFEAVHSLLLTYAGSEAGRDLLRGVRPSTDIEQVRRGLRRTSEARRLLQVVGRQPYHDLPDVRPLLPIARVEGSMLEPLALLDVASFLNGAVETARRVARAEGAPGLSARAAQVADTTEIAAAIGRAILPGGEVADDASPRLAELRRRMARLRVQLQGVMESCLRSTQNERLLQDKIVASRNDRLVLLVKAEHRGQLPGVVHGSSGSGASLFVEPMAAVELNNDIVALQDQERAEIIRILRSLTWMLGSRAEAVLLTAEVMAELDAAQAMALLADASGSAAPEMTTELGLDLRDARHPLLDARLCERIGLPRRSSREPVPVSLRIGFGEPILVISGPNTGGKTVALKTAGLLALMAQCGLHVPAAPGSVLPVFRSVYADIGDEQSIAENLSTFSAHLAAIVEMTRELQAPALILLDEVGAGTDPGEGGALGVALVEHFRQRGAMVVATTHHGLMKSYAQTTAGVACASFCYDAQSYEPTYRLALGVPGRSLALEMAERLGLPPAILADARTRLDARELQAEELLRSLDERDVALRQAEQQLASERHAVAQEAERLRSQLRDAEAARRREAESFARELGRRREKVERQASDAVREAVARIESARKIGSTADKARAQAVRAIRAAEAEALDLPELPQAPGETSTVALAPGVRVRLKGMGIVGEVSWIEGGTAEVAVSGKRLQLPISELIGLAPAPRGGGVTTVTAPASSAASEDEARGEINVVGMRVDEALPQVDKLLDEAALAEVAQVRVIHGFGTGRLRRAVAELLEGHPHVATFHPADARTGGGGVTIVELRQ